MKNGFILAIVLSGVCSFAQEKGGAPSESVGDNFNDGVRNRTLWAVSSFKPTTRLVETDRVLCFDTGAVDPYGTTFAMWRLKRNFVLINADVLETSAVVNVPVYPSAISDPVVRLGLLFEDPAVPGNTVIFAVSMSPSGLLLHVSYGGIGGGGGHVEYTFPTAPGKIILKIRYDSFTNKATFWWRAPSGFVWSRLPLKVNLNALWAIPGNTVNIRPAILGETDGYWLAPASRVYVDNFTATAYFPGL